MRKVCHISSAHQGLDVRIFHKECVSLAMAGYATHLVIAASHDEVAEAAAKAVTLHAVSYPQRRWSRILFHAWRCFSIARKVNADIYHFHDAELIPFGFLFSIAGKKVIYDVHEDLPKDIFTKDWIPQPLKSLVSRIASLVEYFGAKFFFSVVAATPFIAKRFQRVNSETINVCNFPLLHELVGGSGISKKSTEVCYVGGIAKIRGALEVCGAMGQLKSDVRLNLVGDFNDSALAQSMMAMPGWKNINVLGYLDRDGVRAVLGRSMAGLVTLHPVINYVDALPVKMFEYMSAGIPVIASDFPLWREIVDGNNCGLLVDPLDSSAIGGAIDFLAANPAIAIRMGKNGRRAVEQKYNWRIEEEKLLAFYQKLCES